MTVELTREQQLSLLAQAKHLSMLMTAIIKKFGKEQVLFSADKEPGIELVLTAEDLKPAQSGAWNCVQGPGPEKGSIVLKLVSVPTFEKQH